MKKRYCQKCDDTTPATICKRCGSTTVPWPIEERDPPDPVFRGKEASEFARETQARIQRDLKR